MQHTRTRHHFYLYQLNQLKNANNMRSVGLSIKKLLNARMHYTWSPNDHYFLFIFNDGHNTKIMASETPYNSYNLQVQNFFPFNYVAQASLSN